MEDYFMKFNIDEFNFIYPNFCIIMLLNNAWNKRYN